VQTKRPSRQRKWLKLTDDEFFTLATLKFGNPTLAPFNYISKMQRWSRNGKQAGGTVDWCKETPEGRAFVELVVQCGEAKVRAAAVYRRWCESHEVREKKESSDGYKGLSRKV
jgi:hypothetical protein